MIPSRFTVGIFCEQNLQLAPDTHDYLLVYALEHAKSKIEKSARRSCFAWSRRSSALARRRLQNNIVAVFQAIEATLAGPNQQLVIHTNRTSVEPL